MAIQNNLLLGFGAGVSCCREEQRGLLCLSFLPRYATEVHLFDLSWKSNSSPGMMEAGLFPGLAAQLCSWYRSDEMGKPIMWMFGWQNCAGIVGSVIAYGLSYLNGKGGLSGWQW